MKLLLSAMWAATQPSGICRTVVNLVQGLNQAAPDVTVTLAIGSWQREYFEKSLHVTDTPVEIVAVSIANTSSARNLWYMRTLPAVSRATGADVVHLALPIPVVRRWFASPLVLTLHDLYPYDRPENFGFPRVYLNRACLRGALRAADVIACVSETTLLRLQTRFPRAAKKARCVRNAITVSAPIRERARKFPFLLAVAQHRANKNLALLIEAFARCREQQLVPSDAKLLIVGWEGPETARLHRLVDRLLLNEEVEFVAGLTEEELATLYRDCALFVSLSDIEGFGLPLGEAVAAGARAVASRIPAHIEVAHDACTYVDLHEGVRGVLSGIATALHQPRRAPAHDGNELLEVGQSYRCLYDDMVRLHATSEPVSSLPLNTPVHLR